MRLFGQLHALAGVPGSPHAEFLRESVLDWLPTLEAEEALAVVELTGAAG